MSEKTVRPNLVHALALLLLAFSLVLPCPQAFAALKRKGEASLDDTWNPKPAAQDVILPMPGNLSMVFRVVAVLCPLLCVRRSGILEAEPAQGC